MNILTLQEKKLVARMYDAGVDLEKIAITMGVSQGTVSATADVMGCVKRGRGWSTKKVADNYKEIAEYSEGHNQITTMKKFLIGRYMIARCREKAGLPPAMTRRTNNFKVLRRDAIDVLHNNNFTYTAIGLLMNMSGTRISQISKQKQVRERG